MHWPNIVHKIWFTLTWILNISLTFFFKVAIFKHAKANVSSSESEYALKRPQSLINQDFIHLVPGQRGSAELPGYKQQHFQYHQYDKYVENDFNGVANSQEPSNMGESLEVKRESQIFINQPNSVHLMAKYGQTVILPCVIYRQNIPDLINVSIFI